MSLRRLFATLRALKAILVPQKNDWVLSRFPDSPRKD